MASSRSVRGAPQGRTGESTTPRRRPLSRKARGWRCCRGHGDLPLRLCRAHVVARLDEAETVELIPDQLAGTGPGDGCDDGVAAQGRKGIDRNDRCTVDRLADAALAHLDHVREAFTVRAERAGEVAAGLAVTPQDVVVAAAQEGRGEERRLAGGDVLETVVRAGARETRRPVAPAEEAARDDAELVAGREETENQVVVLRPRHVAIADGAEHVGADRERRMRERAFHERLGPYAGGRVDAVEPALVVAEAVAQTGVR